jgi:ribosomal protein S18 acetylase RimI-like enzyme
MAATARPHPRRSRRERPIRSRRCSSVVSPSIAVTARLGIGTALAAHVLATVTELNAAAACRAVVVTALNPAARSWWERLGFHPFDPGEPDQFDLNLLTSEIEATLRQGG